MRIFIGDALGEAGAPLLLDGNEDERTVIDATETRFEEANERKAKQAQLDPLDSHGPMLSQAAALYCDVIPDLPKASAKAEARAAQHSEPCSSGTSRLKDRRASASLCSRIASAHA
jgi:hypothetical protein